MSRITFTIILDGDIEAVLAASLNIEKYSNEQATDQLKVDVHVGPPPTPDEIYELMRMSLRDFFINDHHHSERTINRLAGRGVERVGQLLELTEDDILSTTGLGNSSLWYIKKMLSRERLVLKPR